MCLCNNVLELGVQGTDSFLEGTNMLINILIVPGVFFGENSLGLGKWAGKENIMRVKVNQKSCL